MAALIEALPDAERRAIRDADGNVVGYAFKTEPRWGVADEKLVADFSGIRDAQLRTTLEAIVTNAQR